VHHISKKEFDHGRTRNHAIAYSNADIFVCMTQDAIPADDAMLGRLVSALETHPQAAAAYARQLAKDDCREAERYTRSFNYPEQSRVKTKDDIAELGIKTFFCSNVCAAYNRNIFDRLGGFEKHAIFNEDMVYAGHAVQAGYSIVYEADARVYHSHNYTCMQQLRRNFDLGVSQAQHPEVFAGVSSQSEGIRLVRETAQHLKKMGLVRQIPYLIAQSGYKYIGYQLGTHYKALGRGMILKCTSNRTYWENK